MSHRMLRKPAVLERKGISNSTLYNEIEQELMTKGVSLGARAVGWPEHEVEAIISARIAGKSKEEIRQLVRTLMTDRSTLFAREG